MIRRKRTSSFRDPSQRWVLLRKTSQYLFLGVFLLLLLMARRDAGWPPSITNAIFRLDPLPFLTGLLASKRILAGSILALLTLGLSLFFGRAWCGWICPLGTSLDLLHPKKKRLATPPPAESWRGIKYLLLYATLTASLFGSLFLLALDPLSLLYRGLTTALWPALDRLVLVVERFFFQIPPLAGPVARLDGILRPSIFQSEPAHYRDAFLFGGLLVGVILLNTFAERFWCRYLCPLGGLLGLLGKISWFGRQQPEGCRGCVLCTQACPTGTIDPHRQYASDPGECTLCLECLKVCPQGRTVFSFHRPHFDWGAYDPNRHQALTVIGTTGISLMMMRSGLLSRQDPAHLIRPPGVREIDQNPLAMTNCIRCSACMRACPTNALQPGVLEAGLEGFGAPLLIPRLGYCDYSCNACGQACPVQAIPPLDLSEKQSRVIGCAHIDQNRCIAWADHVDCLVCEEMCPLPSKAIQLEEQQVWGPEGLPVTVKLPHVLREACIGCGICEYKCPTTGESAIRVFSPRVRPFS